MSKFKAHPKHNALSTKEGQKLKGDELVRYVKQHKNEFKGNGDALCVAAGYGTLSKEGKPICEFQPFVKELSNSTDLNILMAEED